jgi:hypothetical protein
MDLDFFTPRAEFNENDVERRPLAAGGWETDLREKGTIYGRFRGAKISFIAYPFFAPSRRMAACGNVRILLPRDIAVMEVIAISQRGRKRDFVDLYWYCTNREPLSEVLPLVPKMYPGRKHNFPHFLKSLTYFADAEDEPLPRLFFRASWEEIKEYFLRGVPRIAREMIERD